MEKTEIKIKSATTLIIPADQSPDIQIIIKGYKRDKFYRLEKTKRFKAILQDSKK